MTLNAQQKLFGLFLVFNVLAIVMKISFASLIVGAGLSFFDVTALEILARAGMTPEQVADMLAKGFSWALPNILLGSMIIVPLWLLTYMLRPPRG